MVSMAVAHPMLQPRAVAAQSIGLCADLHYTVGTLQQKSLMALTSPRMGDRSSLQGAVHQNESRC